MSAISMYKQTDIGAIPRDWVVCELADVASYSQNRVKASNSETNTYVSCDNMLKDKGGVVPASCVPETGSVTKYHAGNILIGNIRPYLKKIWLADKSGTCSADVLCLQTFENPIFLYNVLSSDVFFLHVMSNVKGTKMPRGDKPHIMQYKFPIPSDEEEQRAIATALADVDALIEAKRALLEKKRAIKQGAMQELLTGKRRLLGFPVTPMKHTEIGDLPEDWEVSITKKCLSMPITDGPHETPTLCDDGIPFISAESVSSGNGRIDFSRMRGYISEAYHQECCKKYKPQVNDVYIIKSGSTTGKVAIVKTSQVFNIWSPLAVLRARQSIDPDFLFYSVQSNYYQEQIIQAWGMGTQQNIGMRTLERLKIAYPEYAEQRAIATALSDIDEEIEGLEHELSKLCNLKQGMMQNLLTGRIRLV